MLLALLLSSWFHFLLPMRCAARPGDCSLGADSCRAVAWELWGQNQSATWIAKHAIMEANADSFVYYMSRVRVEAEPFKLERTVLPQGIQRVSFVTPASPAALFYFILLRDGSDQASCRRWLP